MKKGNALIVYLNPEKDYTVEAISGIKVLYKESFSTLIIYSFSSLAKLFVTDGKN